MNDEIEPIVPLSLPFNPDDKIFISFDDESCKQIGEPYSYNDLIQRIKYISGVNEDLMGKSTHLNAETKPSSNPRKCIKCGKIHDCIIENTMTGERIEELDKCKSCFFENSTVIYKLLGTQVEEKLDEILKRIDFDDGTVIYPKLNSTKENDGMD